MSDITKQLLRAVLYTAVMALSTVALAQQQLDVRTVVQKEAVTTNEAGETETSARPGRSSGTNYERSRSVSTENGRTEP